MEPSTYRLHESSSSEWHKLTLASLFISVLLCNQRGKCLPLKLILPDSSSKSNGPEEKKKKERKKGSDSGGRSEASEGISKQLKLSAQLAKASFSESSPVEC